MFDPKLLRSFRMFPAPFSDCFWRKRRPSGALETAVKDARMVEPATVRIAPHDLDNTVVLDCLEDGDWEGHVMGDLIIELDKKTGKT